MKPIFVMRLAALLSGCAANSFDFNLPLDFDRKGWPETRQLTGPIALREVDRSRHVRDAWLRID